MLAKGNKVHDLVEKWFVGSDCIVLAGIGNPIRTDDFVGVKIIQELRGKVTEKIYLIECETVPESYLQEIVEFNPSHVLLLDAALLGLEPGEVQFMESQQLIDVSVTSTHMLPLRLFCDYLKVMTKAKIGLLLVQPKNIEFGEGLSNEVEVASKKIVEMLLQILPAYTHRL